MTRNFRTMLLAGAFSLVAAAGFTALTLSAGESREVDIAETCSHAAWPMIPAGCLEGGSGEPVRYISADVEHDEIEMELRFANAFN